MGSEGVSQSPILEKKVSDVMNKKEKEIKNGRI